MEQGTGRTLFHRTKARQEGGSTLEDPRDHHVQGGGQGLPAPTFLKMWGQAVAMGTGVPQRECAGHREPQQVQGHILASQTHPMGCPEPTLSHGAPKEGHGRADAPSSSWSSSGMFTGKSRSGQQLFLHVLNFTERSRAPA